MPLLILLVFIALPIAEIAVLIKVADFINLWPTIGLIIMTAVIGLTLIRMQGLNSLQRAQSSLNEGRLPVNSITDAVGLMLAGAFLLTPGLITDTLGFALLIPAVRHGIAGYMFKKARRSANMQADMFGMGDIHERRSGPNPFKPRSSHPPSKKGPVIEGEIIEPHPPKSGDNEDEPPRNSRPNGRSPWNR